MSIIIKRQSNDDLSKALQKVISNPKNQLELNAKLKANKDEFKKRQEDTRPTPELLMLKMTF